MLRELGVGATYRRSHGRDIEAACGQLAVEGAKARRRACAGSGPRHRPVESINGGRATMEAWVIRPERLGEPLDAMQLEQIDVPEPGPGEVLVRVMAAGVNYNSVWASLGLPVSIFRYTGYDFHIAGSDASGIVERGRAGRHALEARRRGRDPLQPELRRVRRVQRPRPDGLLAAEDLGLRDELGQVRRVLPRAVPAAAAEAGTADLGGGGVVRPHLLHRLPDARRPGRRSRPATTCSSGAPAAAWGRWRSSSAASTGPTRSPSSRREDKAELVTTPRRARR